MILTTSTDRLRPAAHSDRCTRRHPDGRRSAELFTITVAMMLQVLELERTSVTAGVLFIQVAIVPLLLATIFAIAVPPARPLLTYAVLCARLPRPRPVGAAPNAINMERGLKRYSGCSRTGTSSSCLCVVLITILVAVTITWFAFRLNHGGALIAGRQL